MTPHQQFSFHMGSVRRSVMQADPALRPSVLMTLAREAIRLHTIADIPKPDVVDGLRDIGIAAELTEVEIDAALQAAIDRPFDPAAAAPRLRVVAANDEKEAGTHPPAFTLNPLRLDELLVLEVKPRAQLLSPILPEKGLAMVYAPRGIGKTHFALGMTFAVSQGTGFLNWAAPKKGRVLYADGEMPMAALKERLEAVTAGAPGFDPDTFRLLAADFHPSGLPNLATPEGQAALEPVLEGVELIVLDNLSTLVPAARDNDADSWNLMQAWLLQQRRAGRAVLMVHHAGKGGQQRGTSRREDVLDTVIALRHPSDYNPEEGARFEVHIEKARGAFGQDVKPFEARMQVLNGATVWTVRDLADANLTRVTDLLQDGLSIRDVAEETGLTKSKVARLKKAAEANGITFPKAAA